LVGNFLGILTAIFDQMGWLNVWRCKTFRPEAAAFLNEAVAILAYFTTSMEIEDVSSSSVNPVHPKL
jgi:hypothetical protein